VVLLGRETLGRKRPWTRAWGVTGRSLGPCRRSYGWFNSTCPHVKIKEMAKEAYETWDMYGGRALGAWGAPYTEEAWVKVVERILDMLANVPTKEGNDATT
jgi:hypothetical protein